MNKENSISESQDYSGYFKNRDHIKKIIGELVESKPFKNEMETLFEDYINSKEGRKEIFSLIDDHKTYGIGKFVKKYIPNIISVIFIALISSITGAIATIKMQNWYHTNKMANISNLSSSDITENSSK